MPRCEPCKRLFLYQEQLTRHPEGSLRHRFDCARCDLHFECAADLADHRSFPPEHNICYVCDPMPDFALPRELRAHELAVHNVCDYCQKKFYTRSDVEDHREAQHNVCVMCRQEFESASILGEHLQIHAPTNVQCYGCPRRFAYMSEMVFHLETGSCESGADVRTVDRAYVASHFAHHLNSCLPTYLFRCPQEPCDMVFRFLSDVLQHVEDEHSEELNCSDDFRDFQGAPSALHAFLSVLKVDVANPLDDFDELKTDEGRKGETSALI